MYRNQFTVTDTALNTEILRAVNAKGINPYYQDSVLML